MTKRLWLSDEDASILARGAEALDRVHGQLLDLQAEDRLDDEGYAVLAILNDLEMTVRSIVDPFLVILVSSYLDI